MILEIEYFQGDTLLTGENRTFSELNSLLADIENTYDSSTDNFIPLLCRKYHFYILDISVNPDYTYDRDLKKLSRKG